MLLLQVPDVSVRQAGMWVHWSTAADLAVNVVEDSSSSKSCHDVLRFAFHIKQLSVYVLTAISTCERAVYSSSRETPERWIRDNCQLALLLPVQGLGPPLVGTSRSAGPVQTCHCSSRQAILFDWSIRSVLLGDKTHRCWTASFTHASLACLRGRCVVLGFLTILGCAYTASILNISSFCLSALWDLPGDRLAAPASALCGWKGAILSARSVVWLCIRLCGWKGVFSLSQFKI